MKILICSGPKQLEVVEVPDPPIAKNQVRARTICSAISHGTEMNFYKGTAPFFNRTQDVKTGMFREASESERWTYPVKSNDPGVWHLGYAAVGEVIEVGGDVTKFKVGDVVFADVSHQSQMICNESQCILIPPDINPESAALMANLRTTFNAILDTRIKLFDTVVVSGLGVLGQLVAQMVKMSGGFTVAVDTYQKRLETAKANGADVVLNPLETDVPLKVRELTGNKGADAVLEVSGHQAALQNAVRMAGNDTVITAVGWYQGNCAELNLSEEFHPNRVMIKSSHSTAIPPGIRHMWSEARKNAVCVELLRRLDTQSLITHRFDYSDVSKAFETVAQKPREAIQVLLKY